MANILLQRHTQPDIDSKICYGISDIALHKEFKSDHLPKVLQRLDGVKVSRVYSSPLRRCSELAAHIRDYMQMEDLTIDNRVVELNFGDWELLTWDAIFEREEGKAWFNDYLNCKTPNGESFIDLVARAESFLADIKSRDEDVLVVTHSGFMRAAMVVEGRISLQEAFDVKINYGELIEL